MKFAECVEWPRVHLGTGPKGVGNTRTLAEQAGFSARTLYRAKDRLDVEEYRVQSRKWWRLASDEEE